MRTDPDHTWAELRDEAVRMARRWAVTRMDAETAGASGLADFMAAGETDVDRLRLYVFRAHRRLRRTEPRPIEIPEPDDTDYGDSDLAALERVRESLGARAVTALAKSVSTTTGTLLVRYSRWRHRAAAAVLATDDADTPEGCRPYRDLIPASIRGELDTTTALELREHINECDLCAFVAADRRTQAKRWSLGGILAPVFVLRDRLRGLASFAREHTMASAAAGVVVAGAVTAAVVLPPSPHHTPPPPPATTTTAAPTTTTTTAPAPPPPPPAPTTTTTAPRQTLTASATLATANTAVAITVTARATQATQPFAGDAITYSAPGCGTAAATTGANGAATATLHCPASALPVTVRVTDTRGLASAVRVA